MSSMQRWKSQERRTDFFRHFTILLCAPAFNSEDLEGLRLTQITAEIEKLGFKVVRARRVEDAEMAVQTDAAIGCMVVDWGKKGLEGKTAALINLMRRRGLELPIVILVRRKRLEDIPVEVGSFADAGDADAPRSAPDGAQQCRLFASRSGVRPGSHHHVRGLSARHRHDRPGRAARRARARCLII
jgi:Orn/Lys/Arg decarboxylase, N-terminal domain